MAAIACAGTSFSETDNEVCYSASGSTVKKMWTAKDEPGSSACVDTGGNTWVKGVCNNAKATYEIKPYSDATCATLKVDAVKSKAALKIPDAAYVVAADTYTLHSCGRCPPTSGNGGVVTYILAFFGVVFVYLMVVCVGMYALFMCGATCG